MSFYILPSNSISGTSVWESGNSANSIVQNRTSNKPIAIQPDSLVFGESSYADGNYATIIGSGSTSTTQNSLIIGGNNNRIVGSGNHAIIAGNNNTIDSLFSTVVLIGVNDTYISGLTGNLLVTQALRLLETTYTISNEEPILVLNANGDVVTRDSEITKQLAVEGAIAAASRVFLPLSGGTGGPYTFSGSSTIVSSGSTFIVQGNSNIGSSSSLSQIFSRVAFHNDFISLHNNLPPKGILYKDNDSLQRMSGSTAFTFSESTGLVTSISLSATSSIFCGNTSLDQVITNIINNSGEFGVQQRLDAVNIDFGWGDGEGTSTGSTGMYYTAITMTSATISGPVVTKRYNLITNFSDYSFISQYNPVLLIDRYKSKRRKGLNSSGLTEYAKSGHKHPDPTIPGIVNQRPSEIQITSQKMILDFGQENYFRTHQFPIPKGLKGKKKQYRYNTSTITGKGWNYLRFRIRITKDGTIYESNKIEVIKLIAVSSNGANYISYQYV